MASRKRILSSPEKSPARQNLFGPVDREQLQQEYQDTLRRDLEDTCRRWGFDFLSDKPLAGGDFQWEGVLGTKLPLLYQPCLLGQGEAQREAWRPSQGGAGQGHCTVSRRISLAPLRSAEPTTRTWRKHQTRRRTRTTMKTD